MQRTENESIIIGKTKDYTFNCDDYAIKGELTVTVTLHEYRELVKASEDLSETRNKMWNFQIMNKEKDEQLEKKDKRIAALENQLKLAGAMMKKYKEALESYIEKGEQK